MYRESRYFTKRDIAERVRLRGSPGAYTVHYDVNGETVACQVPSTAIGNAIVKALRDLVYANTAKGDR